MLRDLSMADAPNCKPIYTECGFGTHSIGSFRPCSLAHALAIS